MDLLLQMVLGMLMVISPMLSWPVEFDQRNIRDWTPTDWVGYMRFHNATQSYARLNRELEGEKFKGHAPAHVFGQALYEVFGNNAMAVCDSSYYGGCLHEYNARMILSEGPESLLEALKECEDHWLTTDEYNIQNCRHGAGHALVMLYGYDLEGLEEALQYCHEEVYKEEGEEAEENFKSYECYEGAFMEFNQRNIRHQSLLTHRDFDPADPYYPCDLLDEEYQQSCYYRLTRLWLTAYEPGNLGKQYTAFGYWCSDLSDEGSRETCREGINNAVVAYGGAQTTSDIELACRVAYSESDRYDACVSMGIELLKKEGLLSE